MNFPPPFPLSAFITFHSLSLPSVAFHYLPSPFITFRRLSSPFIAFHYLSSPPHLIVCPLSALPRFVLTSPHFVLVSPRFVLVSPRFVLTSPRSLTMPPHSPASHLLPSCFITPFVSHIRLSRTIVCAPFFYSLCFTHSIVLRPLFYFFPLCFTLSHCLPPSLYLLPPPSLYLLPLFCTRFFTPRQPPQTRPRHRKRQRFSHFSKKFCKKPLTKQKKVLY